MARQVQLNARSLGHCATCSFLADLVLKLTTLALRVADRALVALEDKLSSNESIVAILRDRLGTIDPTMPQPANSEKRKQYERGVCPPKQRRSSTGRTTTLKRTISAMAARGDDELGLDSDSSGKSSRLSDDDSDSESDECTESGGDLSDDDDDDERRPENRKPRARGWSALEEQRLRTYRRLGKDWSWIASKFGRTDSAVKQHWGIMNRDGGQGRRN